MEKKIKPGLYIHIPFCNSICSYCDFLKLFYETSLANKYLDCLKEELKKYSSFQFESIYIGGGTPSSLSLEQLNYLFEIIRPYSTTNSLWTIEVNPDIDEEKIKLLSINNISRVSIGVQTFNKDILLLINRNSDFENINNLINLFHLYNINDINVDLIYGFNNQSIDDLNKDIDLFLSLNITHISTYCLQVEKNTILFNKNYSPASDEMAREQYDFIVNKLEDKGFIRYEVSNFAKKGYESKHNLIYWNNQEYGGVGLNASSYINKVRYTNTKNFHQYLKNNYQDYDEKVNIDDEEFYFIMLGLRKINGISLKEYKKLFNKDFLEEYNDKINDLLNRKLIIIEDDYLKIERNNFFIMDNILKKLLF